MKEEQSKRFIKMFNEKHYLVDYKLSQNDIVFHISGSTQNIYTISCSNDGAEGGHGGVHGGGQKGGHFSCDCPDAKSWAKKHKVLCKHICFLVLRVSKLFDIISPECQTFFETHKLTPEQFQKLYEILEKKQIQNDVWNQSLTDKYNQIGNNSLSNMFSKSTKEISEEDECPICYDILLSPEIKINDLLSCPSCKNFVHPLCMKKWLEYNKTCVYCRSDVWSNLNKEKSGKYINLS
jgi:hypothetical protein